MPSPYLTKSDFKACVDCPTKLFYRKHSYPSNLEDNEYLRFLADGGFMVEFVAKARYPAGIDLADVRDPTAAYARTQELLQNDGAVLFEAAALAGKFYVRTDIIRREGNVLNLIEVKSSSLADQKDNSDSPFLTEKGTIISGWNEYLMDVAFQAYVLRQAFPQFTVKPYLAVVNKSHPVSANETLERFTLWRDEATPKSRPAVGYDGNLTALAMSKIISIHLVSKETDLLMERVVAKAAELAAYLTPQKVTRAIPRIVEQYKDCRVCEYRVKTAEPNGFAECWGALATQTPHILDLYQVTRIGTATVSDPVPPLLERGRASILDLDEGDLGKVGPLQERRLIQWESMRNGGEEHLPSTLQRALQAHKTEPGWPLHFVDFEACTIALPHHAGLRPYERVAFQWSCHSLAADRKMTHSEWLNTQKEFPNFAFVRTLREQIGDLGTVYVWSAYEQTTLRMVLDQLTKWMQRAPDEAMRTAGLPDMDSLTDLADWIDRLLGPEDDEGKRRHSPRIRDLHKLATEYYFHPMMGGRTSIKVVLPAIWTKSAALRKRSEFQKYLRYDQAGSPVDPYKTLPSWPLGEDQEEEAVREGTGAIRTYQDLIFSRDQTVEQQNSRQRLLLQYCELDTAAMVMIWRYWSTPRNPGSRS